MGITSLVLLCLGLVLMVAGAEALVRGASNLAIALGISPLIIGLTVVAYGTSSPEMAVSLQSTFAGHEAISIGNVVGSNIFNVLFILGVSASITPLLVAQQLVKLDVPVMIGTSLLLLVLALDQEIGRLDGILLFSGAVAYTGFLFYQNSHEQKPETDSLQPGCDDDQTQSEPSAKASWTKNLVFIGLGIVLLTVGSRLLVQGAVAIAEWIGLSQLVIGLTLISLGTSLPEVATSVVASIKGERDIAVGNVIGSNIFNILAVLGVAGILSPNGVDVSSAALNFDIPVMIVVAIACLPIFFTGNVITRWEGALFLGYYAAYTSYLILNAMNHATLPIFSRIVIIFVIPLAMVTLVTVAFRHNSRRL
ncbi:MAG: calcium/sodium antiporter [Elainellaceae cyanobacterium]